MGNHSPNFDHDTAIRQATSVPLMSRELPKKAFAHTFHQSNSAPRAWNTRADQATNDETGDHRLSNIIGN